MHWSFIIDFISIFSGTMSMGSGLLNTEQDKYELKATNNVPNRLRSESVGIGSPFDVMQPTVFAGNLFVRAV